MKKLIVIIMAVCMIATLGMATAQAGWYFVNVKGVGGTGANNTYICLSDTAATPAFTNQWFTLSAAMANKHLAVALTAATSGLTCEANFAGSGVPPAYSIVNVLYLNNGYH